MQKMALRKTFSSWLIMQFLGRLWKMWENIEIAEKRKKKELFSIRTKLSYYKVFHKTSTSNRNEKNADTYE